VSQEEGGKTLPPEAEGAVKESGSWKKAGRVVAEGTALVEDLASFLKARVSEQTERVFAALEDFLSEWAWGKSRRGLFCLLQGAEGVEAPKSFAVRFSLDGGVEARFRFYVREQDAKPCEILGVKLRGDGWELEAEAKVPRKEKPWFSARVGFGRAEQEPLSPCEAAETPEGREMVRRFLDELPRALEAFGRELAALLERGLEKLREEAEAWPGGDFLAWQAAKGLESVG